MKNHKEYDQLKNGKSKKKKLTEQDKSAYVGTNWGDMWPAWGNATSDVAVQEWTFH